MVWISFSMMSSCTQALSTPPLCCPQLHSNADFPQGCKLPSSIIRTTLCCFLFEAHLAYLTEGYEGDTGRKEEKMSLPTMDSTLHPLLHLIGPNTQLGCTPTPGSITVIRRNKMSLISLVITPLSILQNRKQARGPFSFEGNGKAL